jgi:hypothetical protein
VSLLCGSLRLFSNQNIDDQAPIIVCTHLEQAFGITCACLPACRSLLEYFFSALKLKLADEPASNSRYLHVYTASGGKIPMERHRRHTSSRSLVELRDVNSRGC